MGDTGALSNIKLASVDYLRGSGLLHATSTLLTTSVFLLTLQHSSAQDQCPRRIVFVNGLAFVCPFSLQNTLFLLKPISCNYIVIYPDSEIRVSWTLR